MESIEFNNLEYYRIWLELYRDDANRYLIEIVGNYWDIGNI